MKAWYREHLGVGGGCGTDENGPVERMGLVTEGGPMVFEPFKPDSDYFPADRKAMVNLRVTDLDGLVAQLRAAGIEIVAAEEWDIWGRPLRPRPRSRGQSDRAVGAGQRAEGRKAMRYALVYGLLSGLDRSARSSLAIVLVAQGTIFTRYGSAISSC